MKKEKATFAAGCFWHIQLEFSEMDGVLKTRAGYTGGELKNPAYEDVCTGKTGHVEAVEVEYDGEKLSYDRLLEKFFKIHNPETIDRQGNDVGSQYNSVIFYHSARQKVKAEKYKKKLTEKGVKVATRILPAPKFYPAEDYHQDYLKKKNLKVCPSN